MTTARLPVGVRCREHHRIGLRHAELDDLFEPRRELGHRIDRKIGRVETDVCVVRAQGGHQLGVH